jgi:glycosyltransferase involved in cell wall biosynthesis
MILSNRPLVLTFGFLGPGKGIELGIKAISYLKDKHPDIIYLVAGRDSPELKKKNGRGLQGISC